MMASGPITSGQIDGETMERVSDFIFLNSKITVDGDCSHEIKRCWLLGRKVMTNLDSILKSRDITLPPKICLVKAMVFPVVMYECESWTVKKREVKSKGKRERYKHLNPKFQRIARRDKKAFLSDQCKEIEENNRMGKTKDL